MSSGRRRRADAAPPEPVRRTPPTRSRRWMHRVGGRPRRGRGRGRRCVRTFVVQTFFIPSASMEPTLRSGTGSWSTSSATTSTRPPGRHRRLPPTADRGLRRAAGARSGQAGHRPARRDHLGDRAATSTSTASRSPSPGCPSREHGTPPTSARRRSPAGDYFVMGDNRGRLRATAGSGAPSRLAHRGPGGPADLAAQSRSPSSSDRPGGRPGSQPVSGPLRLVDSRRMLELSPAKLLVILVVALILLGPDKLPQVARQLGAGWRELRDFRDQARERGPRAPSPTCPPPTRSPGSPAPRSALLNRLADDAEPRTPTATGRAAAPPPTPPGRGRRGRRPAGSAGADGSPGPSAAPSAAGGAEPRSAG